VEAFRNRALANERRTAHLISHVPLLGSEQKAMRITEDRYSQHRRSLDLAWRLIGHEVRTSTISRWTQLSGHRIRALYKSYSVNQRERLTRHRGMSPYKLESILSSPKLRCEAAMFAAICRFLHALPKAPLSNPEQVLPSIERGELLCDAYEWFRFDVPETRLTFEQTLLLVNELARGELVQLATCRTCRGVILKDRLSTGRLQCVFCSPAPETAERSSVVDAQPELPRCSREPLVDRPERKLGEAGGGQQVHVDPTQAAPHQLSCFDEPQDLCMARRLNVGELSERGKEYGASSQIAARQLPDDERMRPNLSLFEEIDESSIAST
jgi:hypothetical protein